MGGSIFDFIAPIIGATLLGQPELGLTDLLGGAGAAALGSGVGSGLATGIQTGNPLAGFESGLTSGAGSFLGSNIGGMLGGGDTSGVTGGASGGSAPSGSVGGTSAGMGGVGSAGTSAPIAGSSASILSTAGPSSSGIDAFLSPGSQAGTSGSSLFGSPTGDSLAAAGNIPSSVGVGGNPYSAGGIASSGGGSFLSQPTSDVISKALGGGDMASGIGNLFGQGTVGQSLGSSVGQNLAGQINAPILSDITSPQGWRSEFTQPGALPSSLSGMSGMPQNQLLSNLATQGVYGGGLGPQEQGTFVTDMMNQLGPQQGQANGTNQPFSSVTPIEQSMLARLGLGGFNDTNSLLQAMSGWQQPNT